MNITFSKVFSIFRSLFSLLIVLFFSFFLYAIFKDQNTVGKMEIIALDIVWILIAKYSILKFLIPSLRKDPAVELSNEGIVDNIRNSIIEWQNVRDIRVQNFINPFIVVCLVNNKIVISQTKNIFKLLYFSNNFFYGSPIVIATQFLNGDNEDICKTFLDYFEKQKLHLP